MFNSTSISLLSVPELVEVSELSHKHEFTRIDGGSTTYDKPGKFWVGFNTQKLTIPSKAFFTGISTQNSPITAIINCNAATDQQYNVMLIAVYDAIIDIDTQTNQVVIVS